MDISKMFLCGTSMILATVLVRVMLKNRLPRFTFVLMWYASALRLLVPFEIKSAISIYPLLPQAADQPVMPPSPSLAMSQKAVTIISSGDTGASHIFLTVVWLCGAAAMLTYFLAVYIMLMKKVSVSVPLELDTEKYGVKRTLRKIKFLKCPDIDSPLTCGTIFPKIYLPENMEIENPATKYVILHEYIHIKRVDSLGKMLLAAALCVNWFNPAAWIMFILASRDIETGCDEAVVNMTDSRKDYALALILWEEIRTDRANGIYAGFSRNIVKERIEHIMNMKNKRKMPMAAALALTAMMSVLAVSPASAESISQENKTEFIWPAENCNEVYAGYGEINGTMHYELDISGENAEGSDIYAVMDGHIEETGFTPDKGNYVIIDHGNGIKTTYTHCKELSVSSGENVIQGDIIGKIGNSGYSTGAHLGFAVLKNSEYIDPMEFYN